MFVEFTLVAVVLVVFQLLRFVRGKQNTQTIKGPKAIPVFGNLLQLTGNVRLKLSEWAKQYGNMYTVHFASTPVVLLSDLKQIRELFGMMISTSKLQNEILSTIAPGRYGIGNAEGEHWIEQKSFCIQNLRLFGFDRTAYLEPIVLQEINRVCTLIDSNPDKSGKISLKESLMITSSKIVFQMIKHDADEKTFLETFHLADNLMANLMTATTTGILFLPWLKHLAPELSGYSSFKTVQLEIRKQVIGFFDARLKTRIRGSPPKDLIDAYIDKIENCEDPQSSFYKETGWQHAYGSVLALIFWEFWTNWCFSQLGNILLERLPGSATQGSPRD